MKKAVLYFASAICAIANTVFFIGVCYLAIKSSSGILAVSGIMLTVINYELCDSLRNIAAKQRSTTEGL